MVETIEDLRKTCQKSKGIKECWYVRTIIRGISIYFTSLFLRLGISANKVTVLSIFPGIIAGILLLSEQPIYWMVAALMIDLYMIFDCCDGEIARYRERSELGRYLDFSVGLFVLWYIQACMTIGLYRMFHDTAVFIFGFLAIISTSLSVQSMLWMNPLRAKNPQGAADAPKKSRKIYSLIQYAAVVFGLASLPLILIAVAILDFFISPVTIGSIPFIGLLTFNARYAFFIIYALAMLAGVIQKTYYTIREIQSLS